MWISFGVIRIMMERNSILSEPRVIDLLQYLGDDLHVLVVVQREGVEASIEQGTDLVLGVG
jgi:hypothetical protein